VSGTQKWLGWPLWLVTAVLFLSAVTGSAGPIQVIWVLGLIWITGSIAGIYLGRWRRGTPGPDHSEADHSEADHSAQDLSAQPPGEDQGSTAGHTPGLGPGPSAG
jgi:hypothetical protein